MDDYSSDSEFEVVVKDEPAQSASDDSTTAEQEGRDENVNLGGGRLVMPVR